MPLTVESLEAESILAEKHAADEFRRAKSSKAAAEEIEQKRHAWVRASRKRKEFMLNRRIGQNLV